MIWFLLAVAVYASVGLLIGALVVGELSSGAKLAPLDFGIVGLASLACVVLWPVVVWGIALIWLGHGMLWLARWINDEKRPKR